MGSGKKDKVVVKKSKSARAARAAREAKSEAVAKEVTKQARKRGEVSAGSESAKRTVQSVALTPLQNKQLNKIAAARDCSKHKVMVRAIERYLAAKSGAAA